MMIEKDWFTDPKNIFLDVEIVGFLKYLKDFGTKYKDAVIRNFALANMISGKI